MVLARGKLSTGRELYWMNISGDDYVPTFFCKETSGGEKLHTYSQVLGLGN